MADSGALRARRHRLHKAGDHTLCRAGCGGSGPDRSGKPKLSVLDATSADFPGHDPGELDPAAEMRRLAAQLAAAYEADPGNALLARELRMTLQSLKPPQAADTGLEELLRGLSS
jgi:hypothetical protein